MRSGWIASSGREHAVARRLTATAVALATVVTLLVSAEAQSSTLTRFPVGSTWAFTADSGKANNVTIAVDGFHFLLSDPAEPITVHENQVCPFTCIPFCSGSGTNSVRCRQIPSILSVNAGDVGDSVSAAVSVTFPLALNGDAGVDRLQGGGAGDVDRRRRGRRRRVDRPGGNDTIRGGAGSDGGIAGGTAPTRCPTTTGARRGSSASPDSGANSDADTFSGIESSRAAARPTR